jgi:hypothetical protein
MSSNNEILLHDYFDNLLSEAKQKEFEDTLLDNIDLAIDLGKLKNLQRNLRNLPSNFTPSEKVIENIIDSLLEEKKEKQPVEVKKKIEKKVKKKKIKKERTGLKAKTKYRLKKLFSFSVFLLFIAAIGSGYYYYEKENSTLPWRVTSLAENISLKLQKFISTGINENSKFSVLDNEHVVISIGNKGIIELSGDSDFSILEGTLSENSINFGSGKLTFTPQTANILFLLKHKGITVRSENAQFQIEAYEGKQTSITVLSNYIEIIIGDFTNKVPYNHNIKVLENNNISLPIISNIPRKLAKLISKFEMEQSYKTLTNIVELSKQENAFTLLALIQKVSPSNRELIINKLQKFIPLPNPVSKVDILMLDNNALNSWWDEFYKAM